MFGRCRNMAVTAIASMRPQPGGCGNAAVLIRVDKLTLASMRPQPGGCGNSADLVNNGALGPGFNEAAAGRLRKSRCINYAFGWGFASMRPQPGGCGNQVEWTEKGRLSVASMRPQPGGCGNVADPVGIFRVVGLQ